MIVIIVKFIYSNLTDVACSSSTVTPGMSNSGMKQMRKAFVSALMTLVIENTTIRFVHNYIEYEQILPLYDAQSMCSTCWRSFVPVHNRLHGGRIFLSMLHASITVAFYKQMGHSPLIAYDVRDEPIIDKYLIHLF